MTDRRLYLGLVERVVPNDRRGPIAHLRPLCEAAPNLLSWHRPLSSEDARREFPNRGLVTWFGPPDTARDGTVWQFRVEEQRTFDPANPHHDAFKIAPAPTPPVEILDLRGVGDEEQVRLQVTQEGLELAFVPSARVYLWVEDDCWIGPLHLVRSPESGRWVLDPQQQQREMLSKVRAAPASQLTHLSVGARRLFLAPGGWAGSRLGQVDWAPDEIVLKRVLRRLRKTDRAYTDALELTEKAIDRAVGVLSDAKALGADLSLDLQRLRRARSIVGSLVERQDLAKDVLRELLQIPSIQADIQAEQDRARQETEEQVRAELEESLSRIKELRGQQSRLEKEIAALQAALAMQTDELAAKVETRLAELMAQPGQALTDLAILRAALGIAAGSKPAAEAPASTRGAGDGPVVPASLPPLPPSAASPKGEVAHLVDQAQLRQTLRKAFRAQAVPAQAVKFMHAAFLAGVMPVLAGIGASRALEAYAASVTGGRWLWMPISPTMLDASDLLGRPDPAARRFVPAPGGLLDLLLRARGTDDLYLVVLDGINRAAVDSYLTPLLACYANAWQREQGRALPLFHPSAVSADDPYASAAWLPWPPNVLLAGTLSDGAATVPIPPSFWTSATLIPLDVFGGEAGAAEGPAPAVLAGPSSPELPLAAVSLGTWRSWREQVAGSPKVADASDVLKALQESGLSLPAELQVLCGRLCAAESTWFPAAGADGSGGEDGRAVEGMVLQCLVPFAVADSRLEALFEGVNDAVPMTNRIERAAKLARELLS